MKTMQAPMVKVIEATAVAKFEIPGHQIIQQDVIQVRLRVSLHMEFNLYLVVRTFRWHLCAFIKLKGKGVIIKIFA